MDPQTVVPASWTPPEEEDYVWTFSRVITGGLECGDGWQHAGSGRRSGEG